MNPLHKIVIISLFIIPISVFSGQAEYDECILKYLKGVKLDIAAHTIKQACEENYNNPSFTSAKQQAYNKCLLEHLVGVESQQAVMDIHAACSRKYK